MALDSKVREAARKNTAFLLNGQPVDPWLVGIDFACQPTSTQPAQLRIGVPIVIFELKQYEVIVTQDTLVRFVADNIKNHGAEALDVYLMIVRYSVNRPPRRKSYGWFARMFTKAPKWEPPKPKWNWTIVNDVGIENDTLVISGLCCER